MGETFNGRHEDNFAQGMDGRKINLQRKGRMESYIFGTKITRQIDGYGTKIARQGDGRIERVKWLAQN